MFPNCETSGHRIVLPVLMIGVAGFVDAAGFRELGQVHVAFMSGNGTHLGSALALGQWRTAQFVCLFVAAFVTGAVAGTLIGDRSGRHALEAVLATELTLLAGASMLAVCAQNVPALALASAAMGMQNVLHQHIAGVELGRTAISGGLVGLGQWLARLLRGRPSFSEVASHALPIAGFFAGAALGAAAWSQVGLPSSLAVATAAWLVITIGVVSGRV